MTEIEFELATNKGIQGLHKKAEKLEKIEKIINDYNNSEWCDCDAEGTLEEIIEIVKGE